MSREFDTLQLTNPAGFTLGPDATNTVIATSGAATITLVDASGIIVLDTAPATLTNKTITDPSNNVAATALQTSTGVPVSVAASAVPVAQQVLTATSATTATWQMPMTTGLIGSTGTGSAAGGTPLVLETLNTADNTVYVINSAIVGRRTDVAGTGAGIGLQATYRRTTGAASLVRVGPSPQDDRINFRDDPNWSASTAANTTSGAITITVNSAAGQTVTWKSSTSTQIA